MDRETAGEGDVVAMGLQDEMITALEALVQALRATSEEGQHAARHLRVCRALADGLKADPEAGGDPLLDGSAVVCRLAAAQQRLGAAAARFRRSQAKAMRQQGMTTQDIAAQFGVTRQRISRLLNSEAVVQTEL